MELMACYTPPSLPSYKKHHMLLHTDSLLTQEWPEGRGSSGRQHYRSSVSVPGYFPVSRFTGELRKYGMIRIHFLKSNQINEMLCVCSTEQRGVAEERVIYR